MKPRWSWLAVAAVIAVAAGGLAYLRVWPPLATVMSASMAPTIKTGDIVVLKKLDGPAQIGDIVAISVPENIRARYGYPPVVIHRVVEIDAEDVVTTRGDAYKEADPFDVPRSALTTKVVATLPAAGRLLAFLGSGLGLVWLAGGVLVFVGMPLFERHREGQRREFGERESLHSTLLGVSEELSLLRTEQRPLADSAPVEKPADAESAVMAELRALTAEVAAREASVATEVRAMVVALAERDAAAAEERRALSVAATAREAAFADELRAITAAAAEREAAAAETLQAVTVSFSEGVAVANRRAATAEEQLRAHLEQLPAQIERAVATALANHVPAPPPPPPPPSTRAPRFVAASNWASTGPAAPPAWDAGRTLAGVL